MVRNEPVETSSDAETADVAETSNGTETSNGAEIKAQTPSTTIKQQENIELRAKRDHLMRRKDMLCAQIALNIRLSGVESISDWVNRISKDVVSWREALTNVESEIENVDAEIDQVDHINRCVELFFADLDTERELMNKIIAMRTKRNGLISHINEVMRELNALRGLSGVADLPKIDLAIDLTIPGCADNAKSIQCECLLGDVFAAIGQAHHCTMGQAHRYNMGRDAIASIGRDAIASMEHTKISQGRHRG